MVHFHESMRRVFPDRPILELHESHPLLHVLYDLDQRTQIPVEAGIGPVRCLTGGVSSTKTGG